MTTAETVVVRAVKATQNGGTDVFSFFVRGSDITRLADISRISRDEAGLKGFQRREIRSHVNSIVEFLNSGPVLFPNAIILALWSWAFERTASCVMPVKSARASITN